MNDSSQNEEEIDLPRPLYKYKKDGLNNDRIVSSYG